MKKYKTYHAKTFELGEKVKHQGQWKRVRGIMKRHQAADYDGNPNLRLDDWVDLGDGNMIDGSKLDRLHVPFDFDSSIKLNQFLYEKRH